MTKPKRKRCPDKNLDIQCVLELGHKGLHRVMLASYEMPWPRPR